MAVSIELKKYKITADELNWILHRKKGKKWEPFEWHTTLPSLLESMGQRELRKLSASTFEDITRNHDAILKEIQEIRRRLDFGNGGGQDD